ncbi:uncharacterized protein EV422DRAFT_119789 [Fimicolochytrium jonesii]|uniref:uncharacterized protein n=1 Tax=Fimicolochytrium jonesii TaxID=1396493 RepID=UPI0022FF14AE|nr:uncharacterized protein EV422DRAFT_119789 [Fimicolochytrium jonesii]KAI8819159.1 hypothetical protein EV422DRAFT_119789 [Fimicolochytrium jonesii]
MSHPTYDTPYETAAARAAAYIAYARMKAAQTYPPTAPFPPFEAEDEVGCCCGPCGGTDAAREGEGVRCRFWQRGACRSGDACFLSHTLQQRIRTPTPTPTPPTASSITEYPRPQPVYAPLAYTKPKKGYEWGSHAWKVAAGTPHNHPHHGTASHRHGTNSTNSNSTGNGNGNPSKPPRHPPASTSTHSVCRYWLQGICNRGPACRFLHGSAAPAAMLFPPSFPRHPTAYTTRPSMARPRPRPSIRGELIKALGVYEYEALAARMAALSVGGGLHIDRAGGDMRLPNAYRQPRFPGYAMSPAPMPAAHPQQTAQQMPYDLDLDLDLDFSACDDGDEGLSGGGAGETAPSRNAQMGPKCGAVDLRAIWEREM